MDKASIVLLNYNGKKYLQQFIPEVLKFNEGHPVYLIDNASTDHSVEFIRQHHPEIKIISLSKNEGFSSGYNLGLQDIASEYYILINTDLQVTSNWIKPVLDLMDNDPLIAACQPKILSYHQPKKFEYAGAAGGFIDLLGYPFCRGRIFNTLEDDEGQYDDVREIFWATGACFFVRADLFHQFKGFDDDFFAHMEEIDLCWRLKSAGYKIYYQGQSKVYHVGGGTLPMNNPYKVFLNFRNNLNMLHKNSASRHFLWKYMLRCVLDIAAAFIYLTSKSLNDSLAILKAHFHFWKSYRKNKSKKEITNSNLNRYKFKEIYTMSIVYSYYFKGKKRFWELNWKN